MRIGESHLWLLLSTLLWSGSVLFGKVSVQSGSPPIHMAALRFVLAAAVVVPVLVASGGWPRGLNRDTWWNVIKLGFLGIVLYNLGFFYALSYTSAAEGALIMAASPVAHFVVAALVNGERLTRPKAMGIAASVVGIGLVVLGGSAPLATAPNRLLGDAIMFLAMFAWALNSLYGKRLSGRLTPAATTALPVAVAAAIYLAVTLPTGLVQTVSAMSPGAWGAMAYLSVASTVMGRVLWFKGLQGVDVTQAGVFFNIMPVWSTVLAGVFLGDSLTWLQAAGGALVLVGVFLTTSGGPRSATQLS